MGIFTQNINQDIYDIILGEGSVFWNEWLIPSVAVSGNTNKVNIYNYLAIQHFKTDFPISIQDNALVCHSGYQSMCMGYDNLPNKYIPGLEGLNWPNAQFMINGENHDFIGEEFNKITCHNLYISNINRLCNWNLRTNNTCFVNNVQNMENCVFSAKQIKITGSGLPKINNCTTTKPVQLVLNIMHVSPDSYLFDFFTKVIKVTGAKCRKRRWKSKNIIKLADIFDISGILVKSVTVQFREYFKGQIKFTKCNGISKSNIEGWDALYSTEL